MEMNDAISALAALAQQTRLEVFRMLVQAGPSGLMAGEIAAAMETPASTMSHHLGGLERAGLIRSAHKGRSIIYSADYEAIRRLLAFLTDDCCGGRPEVCGTGLSEALTC
jgi:Predicted transcriptional regulators